jgi:uncharacterized protein (TIGR03435 family)
MPLNPAAIRVLTLAATTLAAGAQTRILDANVARASHEGGMRMQAGEMYAEGKTLRRLAGAAWFTPERRVIGGPKWVDEDIFDVTLKADTRDLQEFRGLLRDLLKQKFQLQAHPEKRKMPVYVLKAAASVTPKLGTPGPVRSRVRSGDGRIDGEDMSMAVLADHIERHADRYVVDGTGIQGGYRLDLNWGGTGLKGLRKELARLGLDLVEETREVDLLVIDAARQM